MNKGNGKRKKGEKQDCERDRSEKGESITLIENDIPPIKTHDLIKLNDILKNVKYLDINEQELIIIHEVYASSRYPGELGLLPNGMPSFDQTQEFVADAKEVNPFQHFKIINHSLQRFYHFSTMGTIFRQPK